MYLDCDGWVALIFLIPVVRRVVVLREVSIGFAIFWDFVQL